MEVVSIVGLLCMGVSPEEGASGVICTWERDLNGWGVDEETLEKLRSSRPEIAMAYHELLNPDTFRYCCRRIQAAVNVYDAEEMEDIVVGALAHILHNLISNPGRYTFSDRQAVRRFLRGAIRNLSKKLISSYYTQAANERPISAAPAVEMAQQQEYLRIEMQQVLSILPPEYGPTLVLYLRGHQITEISAILKVKEGTVKSRLYRARQILAESSQLGW